MQIRGLHKNIYKAASLGLSTQINSELALARQKTLKNWDILKSKGLKDSEIQEITGISRATFYRRKTSLKIYGLKGLEDLSKRPKRFRTSKIPDSTRALVLKIRQENPTFGKEKIHIILERDHGIHLSQSSVGRILKDLMASGKIKKYRPSLKSRRRRKFNSHAQKYTYGMKGKNPGEMVQFDHMSVSKDGCSFKHFQAWDPASKVMVTQAYSNATSRSAALFLEKVIAEMPFKIVSIQVDGGSEFMRDFEALCAKLGIALYVLPPKRPQWNGGVERGNRTFREDFYDSELFIPGSIAEVRQQLKTACHKYNSYRPHMALNGQTPFEYVNNLIPEAKTVSHVMN